MACVATHDGVNGGAVCGERPSGVACIPAECKWASGLAGRLRMQPRRPTRWQFPVCRKQAIRGQTTLCLLPLHGLTPDGRSTRLTEPVAATGYMRMVSSMTAFRKDRRGRSS